MLAKARSRLSRLTAADAAAAQGRGALIVDIRTERQRSRDGSIPGAIAIERTVLEWRLDPTSEWRIPQATHTGVSVILICAEGFSSSLAAASLRELGLTQVTDVIDGFEAWRAAGLPITR